MAPTWWAVCRRRSRRSSRRGAQHRAPEAGAGVSAAGAEWVWLEQGGVWGGGSTHLRKAKTSWFWEEGLPSCRFASPSKGSPLAAGGCGRAHAYVGLPAGPASEERVRAGDLTCSPACLDRGLQASKRPARRSPTHAPSAAGRHPSRSRQVSKVSLGLTLRRRLARGLSERSPPHLHRASFLSAGAPPCRHYRQASQPATAGVEAWCGSMGERESRASRGSFVRY